MHSIEHVREYLEEEIGEETLMKVFPILLDFGDDIHLEENTGRLADRLKHLMSADNVKRYINFFVMLVFFE